MRALLHRSTLFLTDTLISNHTSPHNIRATLPIFLFKSNKLAGTIGSMHLSLKTLLGSTLLTRLSLAASTVVPHTDLLTLRQG